MGNFGQLYVNLRGRELQGIVSPGPEYEALLEDLTRRLKALVDPRTGQPVVETVMRREEIYNGPYADQAPDLMFLTRNMEFKAMGLSDFASTRVFDPVYGTTGHHRMDGILIGRGPDVLREGAHLDGARIQDLAPTILYMMGQPIPRELDGRVLEEMFTDAFRQQHAVTYLSNDEAPRDDSSPAYSDREEADVIDVLRALGYVS
jgi:predicted AlkP superfamily phosphohydrolase/phosphomutase